jgi:hypothetical protein
MAESPTENFEHAEHAHHAAEAGDPFLTRVSVTIALLAVMTAFVGSLETLETSGVTVAKSEAVLAQNKATDSWNFFQAKSMKGTMYQLAADASPDRRDAYLKEVARYKKEQDDIQKEATAKEHEAETQVHEGERHEKRHHILTVGATLLQISIAIATISIIMRGQRWPWYVAVALGTVGAATAASAYLQG